MIQRVLAQRYELLETVGSGGMADVYRAHDRLLDRSVAVKILRPHLANDSEFLDKFQREAKAAAKLTHANIVNIFDVGQDAGNHFIVMEYVSGDTLKNHINKNGQLRPEQVLQIAIDIAGALEAAHRNNLIHCDIKPHNILLMDNGHVKVADFGIARAVTSSTMTYGGDIIGSVHYFSPEQAKGTSITPKSDIYSLGVCMYEMLTGSMPFQGENSVSIALKHLQDDPVPMRQINPDVPPVLEAIVQKAMSKKPELRPNSTELIADLNSAMGQLFHKITGNQAEDPFATQVLRPITQEDESKYKRTKGRGEKPVPVAAKRDPVPEKEAETDEYSEPEESGSSIFKAKKFWLGLILIMAIGFGVGTFMSYGNFWSTAEVEVPNVVGRQAAIAQQMIEEKNLRVNVAETYDIDVPEGQVASQYPEAGSKVKEQREITIYVSKGGEELVMPDLKGMSKENAQSKLKRMGLVVVIYEENDEADAGTVIKQDIPPGTKINKGKTVDIIVSKGEKKKTITMPNYIGMSIDSARDNIIANGLAVDSVSQQPSSEPAGTVIDQTPSAGVKIQEGSAVRLVVSNSSSRDNSETNAPHKQDQRAADTAEAQGLDESEVSTSNDEGEKSQ